MKSTVKEIFEWYSNWPRHKNLTSLEALNKFINQLRYYSKGNEYIIYKKLFYLGKVLWEKPIKVNSYFTNNSCGEGHWVVEFDLPIEGVLIHTLFYADFKFSSKELCKLHFSLAYAADCARNIQNIDL